MRNKEDRTPEENEILAAIVFYERDGKNWMSVVGYLSAKALGTLPDDVRRQWQNKHREVKRSKKR